MYKNIKCNMRIEKSQSFKLFGRIIIFILLSKKHLIYRNIQSHHYIEYIIGLVRKLDLREHIGFNILNHLYINASDNDISKEIM